MEIKKIHINKFLAIFLFSHLIIWTLVPFASNENLPLDVIEAIVWSDGWPLGWAKHPPLSSWFPGFIFFIFGNQDWAYYLLSQIFVILSFFVVWKFSEEFFENKYHSLIAVLLLEGIYFYNFTTPEFNVNICQLPFWALSVLYCWKGIKNNKNIDWLLFGLFAALGILSKYLFIYLLLSIDAFFIYLIFKKRFNYKSLVSLISFFLVLLPHLIWLINNDYITISYGLHRAGSGDQNILDHLIHPLIFLGKQVVILIPFFIMCLFLVSKFKFRFNLKDKKLLFLISINFIPIVLIFLTSLIMGVKIRTMWMTPFYLFSGVLFVYVFKSRIILRKMKYFLLIFLILFIFSPLAYLYISVSQTDKRTDYPGKKIARIVQEKWKKNFQNKIGLVSGDEWHGGNLFYHLVSKPKWDHILKAQKITKLENKEDGVVIIGDVDILSNICSGLFFKIDMQGICMIGIKK